jgi:DNA-binding NtrC family response regulator
VGADPRNDLVLDDPAVSARHFELVATEEGYLLTDLESTNGTYVDGRRVRSVYLDDRALIGVGETIMLFSVAPEELEIPLSRKTSFGGLLGHSPSMRAAFAVLERAARSEATLLILGESGTGKELAARAVHEQSSRREGPYEVLDCGSVSESLLASQLFGHARGAFTGASEARPGLFEAAHSGTLVLDEVGEMPLDLQPKLLRALETRAVARLGETQSRQVDVRFVACTNRNLEEEVRAGRFRQDLFFRLSVLTVRLPPLRERKEEIPRLVRHFVSRIAQDSAQDVPEGVLALLGHHDWPGNVRELRNFAERYVALPEVDPVLLLPSVTVGAKGGAGLALPELTGLDFHEAKRLLTDRFEKAYLERMLDLHGDNLSALAREANLSRPTCYRLLQKHGLRSE